MSNHPTQSLGAIRKTRSKNDEHKQQEISEKLRTRKKQEEEKKKQEELEKDTKKRKKKLEDEDLEKKTKKNTQEDSPPAKEQKIEAQATSKGSGLKHFVSEAKGKLKKNIHEQKSKLDTSAPSKTSKFKEAIKEAKEKRWRGDLLEGVKTSDERMDKKSEVDEREKMKEQEIITTFLGQNKSKLDIIANSKYAVHKEATSEREIIYNLFAVSEKNEQKSRINLQWGNYSKATCDGKKNKIEDMITKSLKHIIEEETDVPQTQQEEETDVPQTQPMEAYSKSSQSHTDSELSSEASVAQLSGDFSNFAISTEEVKVHRVKRHEILDKFRLKRIEKLTEDEFWCTMKELGVDGLVETFEHGKEYLATLRQKIVNMRKENKDEYLGQVASLSFKQHSLMNKEKDTIEQLRLTILAQDEALSAKDEALSAKDEKIRELENKLKKEDKMGQNLGTERQDDAPSASTATGILRAKKKIQKPWKKIHEKTKKRHLEELDGKLQEFCCINEVDEKMVLGFLLHKSSYVTHRNLSKIGLTLDKGDFSVAPKSMQLDHGAYLMSLNIGRTAYNNIKKSMKGRDCLLMPAANQINEHINNQVVNLEYHDIVGNDDRILGQKFDTIEFTRQHFRRFIQSEILKGKEMEPGIYSFVAKSGYDTAKHTRYNLSESAAVDQKQQKIDLGIMDFAVLEVRGAGWAGGAGNEDYKFIEQAPNSDRKSRTLALLEDSEDSPTTKKLLKDTLEDFKKLETEGVEVEIDVDGDIRKYRFVATEIVFRADGKVNHTLCGIGSTHLCLLCESNREEWSKTENYDKPMKLRDIKESNAIFGNLIQHSDAIFQDGKWNFSKIQTQIRKGVTAEPLTDKDIYNFTVMHKWMKNLDWLSEIMIAVNQERKTWTQRKNDPNVKKEWGYITEALKPGDGRIGIKYHMADPASGGTTTTKGGCQKVYTNENLRDRYVNCFRNETLKPVFKELVENDRIILGCMSSSKKIKVQMLKELCKRQYELVDKFRHMGYEIMMTPSVHELYQHLPQKIENNNGEGLKKFSEEGLEASHKLTKKYREYLARKSSTKVNTRDVLRRLTFRSDPCISSFEEKTNRCGLCSEIGHNRVTCEIKITGLDSRMLTYFELGVEDDIESDDDSEMDEIEIMNAEENEEFEYAEIEESDGKEEGDEEDEEDDYDFFASD